MSEELKLNENVGAPQPDALARIARKDDFLQQLQEFLAQHKGENWCVSAIDIEHFKLYNELYGAPQAKRLLQALASLLLEHAKATYGEDDLVWYHSQGGLRPHAAASYAVLYGSSQAALSVPAANRAAALQAAA